MGVPGFARVQRKIGTLTPNITVEEDHQDDLTVTDHPVEQGAQVSDHAYKNPVSCVMRLGWSNSDRQAGGDPGYIDRIYRQLLDLQARREPLELVTGKRKYSNMLIRGLSVTTDQTTSEVLMVSASLREVIIVQTKTTTVPSADKQADPAKTGAVQSAGTKQPGPAPNFNASAAPAG